MVLTKKVNILIAQYLTKVINKNYPCLTATKLFSLSPGGNNIFRKSNNLTKKLLFLAKTNSHEKFPSCDLNFYSNKLYYVGNKEIDRLYKRNCVGKTKSHKICLTIIAAEYGINFINMSSSLILFVLSQVGILCLVIYIFT